MGALLLLVQAALHIKVPEDHFVKYFDYELFETVCADTGSGRVLNNETLVVKNFV